MKAPSHSSTPVAPLTAHLGYWLRFVSNHVSLSFARKVQETGATVAEWVILRHLLAGATAPSLVARDLGMTRGAITKLADRLIAKGLVARRVDAADGRRQTLDLTAEGRALVPVLADLADSNDAEFFDHLTPDERQTLMRLLQEIVERRGLTSVPVD